MFIHNFKVNGKLIFKVIFVILFILIFVMLAMGVLKIINNSKNTTSDRSDFSKNKVNVISTRNYTNVLNTVHNDIDTYVRNENKFYRICI